MPASYEQGFDAQAKQSTRYLARERSGAGITSCNTDASQRLLNLTAGASFLFEASPASARFDFSHPRTIIFRITANATDTGSLFRHGAASPTRFAFPAASQIRATVNNATAGTLALTGLDGTRDTLVVAWTSMANPDTTGASDAVLSTLYAWNVTNSTLDKLVFTHAVSTTKTQTAYFGAQDNTPTLVFSGTITAIVFENRCLSATEIAADWVSALVPPTSSAETDLQGIPPQASTIDGQNFHHGPAAAWACDATRRMIRRTLQALRVQRFRTTPSWTAALLAAANPFIQGAPGSSSDRMHLAWLLPAPVPDNCNRVWVRVHIRSWTTSGAAVPIRARLYSMSRPPGAPAIPGDAGNDDPLVHFHVNATITRDDDASVGQYTVLGTMPIARGAQGVDEGMTYLALTLQVDPSSVSANDANARIAINSVDVVPYYREDQLPLPVSP